MGDETIVERRTRLPVSARSVWDWYAAPGWGAFERLAPPWLRMEVLERPPALVDGARLSFRLGAGPFRVRWVAEYRDVQPERGFLDFQVEGPFERWVHEHRLEPREDGTCVLHDRIGFVLPLGMRPGRSLVERELGRTLVYRHDLTRAELLMHERARGGPPLHVAITGASGLIGSALIPALRAGGHRITRLVRHRPGAGEIGWDPAAGRLDPADLAGVHAVVHLAGENIGLRWNAERKRRILASRRDGTRLIAEAMARCPAPPRVLVSASAVGIYGNRGDEVLTESAGPGRGFLAEVGRAWEDATGPAEAAGIRVARLRMGVVLTPRGALLRRMLLPFRLGVGGRLGSGRQWLSWISIDDAVDVFHRALTDERVRGSVNAAAPGPVRNRDFTRILAQLLGRPAVIPVPRFALQALFGEMADEAIFMSSRVAPEELTRLRHTFRHESVHAALAHLLGRS